jgi:hypothetical protein
VRYGDMVVWLPEPLVLLDEVHRSQWRDRLGFAAASRSPTFTIVPSQQIVAHARLW